MLTGSKKKPVSPATIDTTDTNKIVPDKTVAQLEDSQARHANRRGGSKSSFLSSIFRRSSKGSGEPPMVTLLQLWQQLINFIL